MDMPEIRYAKSGDVRIAYQVAGGGPLDLVFVPGFISNLEAWWEDPEWAHLRSRLAAFSRLILFDKRGTGFSMPRGIASLEVLWTMYAQKWMRWL
jgi:pimeloyl-ACP methyl ester carboxylesterase